MEFPYVTAEEYRRWAVTSIPSSVPDDPLAEYLRQASYKIDSLTLNRPRVLDAAGTREAMQVAGVKEAVKLQAEYLYGLNQSAGAGLAPVVSQHIQDATIQYSQGNTAQGRWAYDNNVCKEAYTILESYGLTYRGRRGRW